MLEQERDSLVHFSYEFICVHRRPYLHAQID